MKLKQLRPHSLTYFLSIILGLMMFLVVVLTFLRFAKGNILIAASLAITSTLLLGVFLSWVDIHDPQDEKNEKNKSKSFARRSS